jgi:hypothetical protein
MYVTIKVGYIEHAPTYIFINIARTYANILLLNTSSDIIIIVVIILE